MPAIANQATVTANGEYSFDAQPVGREMLVEWDITAGTATVTPGYISLTGLFKPARDNAGNVMVQGAGGGLVRLHTPNSGIVALKVESASGLSMKACAVPLNA